MRLLVTKMANGYFMSENYRIEDVLRDIYKELKDINNRLSIIETQMEDTNKRLNAHDDQIRRISGEIGTLEKEVFQSLIGRLQTSLSALNVNSRSGFQSLIGRLQTRHNRRHIERSI